MRAFYKKIIFTEVFFFRVSRNPVRKSKIYKMKELIQNLAIKNYHKFQVRPLKDIEMLILVTSIYLLTKVILSCILH